MNTGKTTYKGLTLPEGFAPTKIEGEDSIDDGLVITDRYGNEYVWVEVPKTDEVYPTAGVSITNFTPKDYEKIENDLHNYTRLYRNNTDYSDTYSADDTEGWFKKEDEYNEAKQNMLKSVYKNGGFWVGRYEAGIEEEVNIRKQASNTVTLIPVTKQNMYPYNYVTRTQAKKLAEQVESGSCTSGLMFGVQWDLVLKFIEEKTVVKANEANKNEIREKIEKELNNDSTNIGNYRNNLWNITNSNIKYSTDNGTKFNSCPYIKNSASRILLVTGAKESFSMINIYDVAGNVWEWTLEKTPKEEKTCTSVGGNYYDSGYDYPASKRYYSLTSGNTFSFGFRIALY